MEAYRNILIAVVGMTPQIVTETLYALLTQKPSVRIEEIHLISTTSGIESIQKKLLIPGEKILYQFFEDYKIPAHQIDIKPVTITHFNGQPLADIRTTDENEAAREFIVRYIARESRCEKNRIFASIAGGRKTMSAYMSLAMNLYGREQDRLSHVLVNPSEHELDPNFFYPKPHEEYLTLRNGQQILSKEVKIDMADIPFIQLRPLLKNYYRNDYQNIETLFQISQASINAMGQNIKLRFYRKDLTLEVLSRSNSPIRSKPIPPKEATIYWLAFHSDQPLDLQLQDKQLADIYQQLKNREFDREPDWTQESIQKKIYSLNKILANQFPPYLYSQIKLEKTKIDYLTHYFIPLPKADREMVDH